MSDDTPILPSLSPVDNFPIHAKFDVGAMSSNGGTLLLHEVGRGNALRWIKQHKTYLASDRTSCHRWEANQFRLLLHTAAYWLMLDMRNAAPRKSRWRTATFETIRTTFLKIVARIETMKTRIRVSFPTATPNTPVIAHMLTTIAARAP